MICFDIETITNRKMLETHPEDLQSYATRKGIGLPELCLHPPMSQVVAIAWGSSPEDVVRTSGPDELEILSVFREALLSGNPILAGHNIKGFDIPTISFRMMANGLSLPPALQLAGRKPWEIHHLDSLELLQNGKGPWISLHHACIAFGIPSPKMQADGGQVHEMAEAGKWAEIGDYCAGDVVATMKLIRFLATKGLR